MSGNLVALAVLAVSGFVIFRALRAINCNKQRTDSDSDSSSGSFFGGDGGSDSSSDGGGDGGGGGD